MNIDLMQFCSQDETRPSIQVPFGYGEHTYATDGRILVRVNDLKGNPPAGGKPELEAVNVVLAGHWDWLVEHPLSEVPAETFERCFECGGSGKIQVGARRFEICEHCEGVGEESVFVTLQIGARFFDAYYLRMIATLPGVKFLTPKDDAPSDVAGGFTFEGGLGRVMPIKMPPPAEKGARA